MIVVEETKALTTAYKIEDSNISKGNLANLDNKNKKGKIELQWHIIYKAMCNCWVHGYMPIHGMRGHMPSLVQS